MKTIIYALCAFSAILLIALVYTALKLRDTEARRKKASAKAAVLIREKRQHSRHNSMASHYARERFDEYEQTIEDLERQLDAAKAENESLKRSKKKFSDYIKQAVEAGKVHSPC